MLREVKIHDSALLPKVQFNPGKGGGGAEGGGGRADFYDRLSPYLELEIRVILH